MRSYKTVKRTSSLYKNRGSSISYHAVLIAPPLEHPSSAPCSTLAGTCSFPPMIPLRTRATSPSTSGPPSSPSPPTRSPSFPDTFSVLPRPSHPWSSLSCMVFDVTVAGETLRLVNIYHQVEDSRLSNDFRNIITTPPPSSHLPHLIAGDLNTHSRTWSLPAATVSPWAQSVDHWLVDHDFQLVSETDNPTWRSHSDPHLVSVIDVLLLNTPAVVSDQFSTSLSSFADSYGSDHAALSISWTPLAAVPTFQPLPLPVL